MPASDSVKASQISAKLPKWAQNYTKYGADDPVLQKLLASYDAYPMNVEVQETSLKSACQQDTETLLEKQCSNTYSDQGVVFRNAFQDITSFIDWLDGLVS